MSDDAAVDLRLTQRQIEGGAGLAGRRPGVSQVAWLVGSAHPLLFRIFQFLPALEILLSFGIFALCLQGQAAQPIGIWIVWI